MGNSTFARYYIAYTSLYTIQYPISSGLDLLVLFAYYRLGKKLSTRAAKLVINNLRSAS